MLKDNKDTSTSDNLGIGCDEDLNTTEKAYSDTTIIGRKVVAYFNDLTKHTSNEVRVTYCYCVPLSTILMDYYDSNQAW